MAFIEGIKNSARFEEHVMDTRSCPPRIFNENNLIVPYNWSKAMGNDIIRKIKIKKTLENEEEVKFFDEVEVMLQSKSKFTKPKTMIYQIILTDASLYYCKVMKLYVDLI